MPPKIKIVKLALSLVLLFQLLFVTSLSYPISGAYVGFIPTSIVRVEQSSPQNVSGLDGHSIEITNCLGTNEHLLFFSTSAKYDAVIVAITTRNNQSVLSVHDGAGLVWQRRALVPPVSIWWAPSKSILTNDYLSISFSSPISSNCAVAEFAVVTTNFSSPFDANLALPSGYQGNNTRPKITEVATINQHDFVYFIAGYDGPLRERAGSNAILINSMDDSRVGLALEYNITSQALTGNTFGFTKAVENWGAVADAIMIEAS